VDLTAQQQEGSEIGGGFFRKGQPSERTSEWSDRHAAW